MWYTKNLRIAQDNSVKVNTSLKSSTTIPLYEKNKTNPAFKNFGKINSKAEYLGDLVDGVIKAEFNDQDNFDKFDDIQRNRNKNYFIDLQIDFDASQPSFQLMKIFNHNLDVSNDFILDFYDSNKDNFKFSFPTDNNGDFISSFSYKLTVTQKVNIDFSKIIKPMSNPQVALPGTAGSRSGIGISMSVLDHNISVSPPELRLLRQPILTETKIITDNTNDLVTDNTNDLVSTKPVKYQKYNFPINVESLAKSTYNFKAPVEIYIDGILKIKGHPNQSLYPLYSENMPLSEGIHTLQAKDPKFNTTNTKIMNTQTFTFEVKENQPIKIIKEDPRPGSF